MAKQPSPETIKRLRALCERITVAEDIDPDIQEELLGHVEDKFRAYLDGSERLTEEDALILVREHFGDPAQVKALLQYTHEREATLSLGRRLAAVTSATLACYIVLKTAILLGTTLLMWSATKNEHVASAFPYLSPSLQVLLSIGTAVALCCVVYRWRTRIDWGTRPWFMTWSPRRVMGTVAALALALFLVPSMAATGTMGLDMGLQTSSWANLAFIVVVLGMATMALLAQSVAWLWWCDRPPRTARSLSYTTLTWALVTACSVVPVTTILVTARGETPTSTTTITNHAMEAQFNLFTFATGQEHLVAALGFIPSLVGILSSLLPNIIVLTVAGWIARGLYALAQRARKALVAPPLAM